MKRTHWRIEESRPHHWRLDGKTPVPMDDNDILEWAGWFAKADRIVKQQEIGPYVISTVFLGLDHNFTGEGPPVLFETMIFSDGASLDFQDRCSTWDEALVMHERGAVWATEEYEKHRRKTT